MSAETKLIVDTTGYAPRVPVGVTPSDESTSYDLVLIVRNALQNGANPTAANVAFALLVDRLEVPVPDLLLDPEPYAWDDPQEHRSAYPKAHDSIYGIVTFKPRWGYEQRRVMYPNE